MAKQVIGIGATANDGTGDALRTAFDKVNQNFTDLYANRTGAVVSRIDSNVYHVAGFGYSIGGAANTANVLYAFPLEIRRALTFTHLGFHVVTGVTGNARVGLYSDSNGQPGTLLVDSGALSTAATGNVEATISQAVAPGLNWLVYVSNAAPTIWVNTTVIPVMGYDSNITPYKGLSRSFTYAALPADESASTYTLYSGNQFVLWART